MQSAREDALNVYGNGLVMNLLALNIVRHVAQQTISSQSAEGGFSTTRSRKLLDLVVGGGLFRIFYIPVEMASPVAPRRPSNSASPSRNFFQNKVADIKSSIADRLLRVVGDKFAWDKPHTGTLMNKIPLVTAPEVMRILNTMPSKSSPLDFLPSSLLKSCSDIFSPVICKLANLSFTDGHFPGAFKMAQITPLLKKPGLDVNSPSNYRPISNLNTISKILERLFSSRLNDHIKKSKNLNPFQSAYRKQHSTETALLRIMDDIFTTIDDKKIIVLVSLDLSAAFDTLDHFTLLHRLEQSFGVSGLALRWISTYLVDRTQYVKVDVLFRNIQQPVRCSTRLRVRTTIIFFVRRTCLECCVATWNHLASIRR